MSAEAQRPQSLSRRAAALVGLVVIVLAAAGAGYWAGARAPSASAAPVLADPAVTGQGLADTFFKLLQAKDKPGLEQFLSPSFQLLRADGSANGKTDYLAGNLPTIQSYALSGVTATQEGSLLVARYTATVTGVTNGKPYSPGPAPRLSTFVWSSGAWRLAGHANFDALAGTAPAPTGTSYKLTFIGTSAAADNRFHQVGPDAAIQYGTARITGSATLGSTPVGVELLVALDLAQGSGPFDGFLTLTSPNGDVLGFTYAGSTTWDGTTSRILGTVRTIGGTGALAGVIGGGSMTSTRTGPVGSPVECVLTLALTGLAGG